MPRSGSRKAGSGSATAYRPPDATEVSQAKELYAAVMAGDAHQLAELLARGIHVNVRDAGGFTCAHALAASPAPLQLLQPLLQAGLDVNVAAGYGNSPLQHAVRLGNVELVSALVGAGADANRCPRWEGQPSAMAMGERPLTVAFRHCSVDTGVESLALALTTTLLDGGADPNLGDDSARPAFFDAVNGGNAVLVELLLRRGADPNVALPSGITPLWLAIDNARLCQILLAAGASPSVRDREGLTLLAEVVERGCADVLRVLLEHGASLEVGSSRRVPKLRTRSVLHRALSRRDRGSVLEMIEILLSAGADPNARDKSDGSWPVLHAAVQWSEGDPGIVAALVAAGADPKARGTWRPDRRFEDVLALDVARAKRFGRVRDVLKQAR